MWQYPNNLLCYLGLWEYPWSLSQTLSHSTYTVWLLMSGTLLSPREDIRKSRPLGNCSLKSVSVQFSRSVVSDSLWPHESQTQTHVPWVGDAMQHLILCHSLFLLPPIPPSIRDFSNESTLPMRWPKYWSFSFSIIPSKEIPGLISFRMDWLDLLAV